MEVNYQVVHYLENDVFSKHKKKISEIIRGEFVI